MGWLVLLALAAAALALLLWLGLARSLWTFVGAALMLGAAGYALQGRPGLAGAPAAGRAAARIADPIDPELRRAFFGRFNFEDSYFIASEALIRSRNPGAAAQWMLNGINKAPGSAALWVGLANALLEQDGGRLSPAGRLAFGQAMRVAPRHPGPSFFYGLALVRQGEYAAARRQWLHALSLSPADSDVRAQIAVRLVLLDRLLREQPGAPAPR